MLCAAGVGGGGAAAGRHAVQGGVTARAGAGLRQQKSGCVLGGKTAAGRVAGCESMGARDSERHCDCAGAFALERCAGGSPAKIAAGAAGRSILGELPETSSIGWPYIIRDGAPAPALSLSLLSLLLLLLLLILLILLHHCPHSHARLASAKGDKR